jgi:hypothetical protein
MAFLSTSASLPGTTLANRAAMFDYKAINVCYVSVTPLMMALVHHLASLRRFKRGGRRLLIRAKKIE